MAQIIPRVIILRTIEEGYITNSPIFIDQKTLFEENHPSEPQRKFLLQKFGRKPSRR